MLVRLSRAAAVAVRRGHPWVYREGMQRPPRGLEPGAPLELADEAGRFCAQAFWDPDSPIAARVVSRDAGEPFDGRLLARRAELAFAKRDRLDVGETDALRMCNGEGDGAPGLVVDRYADVAVARLDTPALTKAVEAAADAIFAALAARGVRAL
ncbi:MAG TPA: class I SAM-dependent rRNA methyltransferase, partial [Minicystis sp.]|nr:class I SAM-dependent rRNA methyltransferase [Minicystis sp.]